ncbi:MAG: N-6 DNA methylase [Coriobacteriaceae bacterium]|nr:N-6 DNA methylase [Coriobacteriaceae bacterium]
MDSMQRKKNATAFAAEWGGRGYEKGDAQVFWTELLRDVVGIQRVSSACRFEYRTASGGFIDCLIPDTGVIIEQKGLDIDLDKPEERQGRMVTPFEQALAYAESFPRNSQPRFIVVCNFATFRVHDRDACPRAELAGKYIEFTLDELGQNPHLLDFVIDPANSRAEREKQVSIEAGRLIGELHAMLQEQYIDAESDESQKALNILCVRLVFCLFCEDAELFPKDALLNYLRNVDPANMRVALKGLFKALNTPIAERDPYDESVKPFPYVNGGLFAEESEIPNFTEKIKFKLLFEVSQQIDWSQISPTIFGGIFESTLNPETRRSGGMHYTSPENIHKVIDPLFLDALQEELDSIRSAEGVTPRKRKNALRRFRKKLASLKFLDPACGSGNFLTETYLSLRRLEDDVLSELNDGQMEMVIGEESEDDAERVTLSQFYGIEINDFAVRVARTALWIAQLQANNETDMLLDVSADDFPLHDSANIVEANALRIDWNEVLSASECSYIMGNPPFLGGMQMSRTQKSEMKDVFNNARGFGELDYVCAWYIKSAEFIHLETRCAFVSTNSISQGLPVGIFWRIMKEEKFCEIDFCHRTFAWNNEASDTAHVHCVIVGFSKKPGTWKKTITTGNDVVSASNINGYLFDAPDVFITEVSKPLCPVPPMRFGSMPRSKGFTLTADEKLEFINENPLCEKWIRPYWGADEFLKRKERFCLWLVDAEPDEVAQCDLVVERINQVRQERLASKAAATRKFADSPTLFAQIAQPEGEGHYLLVPRVSSEKRAYVPIGFVSNEVIASDLAYLVPNAELYHFGVMSSQFHNAWMRMVAGRLKSDYRYAKDLVYNTFPWPQPSASQRELIENCAANVLSARKEYPQTPLGKIYSNLSLFADLAKAHRELDAAVEAAYGVDFEGDEEKIVAHLFKLYTELTNE